MDIIQRTVMLMSGLIQRIKKIADLLKYNSQTSDDDKEGFRLFWIFNW